VALKIANLLVSALGLYGAIGLAFGILFAVVGAGRIDPVAKGGMIGFRLLLIPGAAALWPFLLRRWLGGSGKPPTESNAHRRAVGGEA
jgi:hypothetical protein